MDSVQYVPGNRPPDKGHGMKLSPATTIGIVGLGYVGLSLASAFGRVFRTIGFDQSGRRVEDCRRFRDATGELSEAELRAATKLEVTRDASRLRDADVIIVAVPTPVDEKRLPDFRPLVAACDAMGRQLKPGVTVVFESTVYPGATEEVCIPALESASGGKWKRDFFVGYSPERINPGDRERTLRTITKVVSGDTPETLDRVAALYEAVVDAGVHRVGSIRVAEAAKVIENTQRDLNIALVNELAIIFHRLGIDTGEVLAAAGTKWNFLGFKPGLVGGHCIGVDPYYLTHAAGKAGHQPDVILAGRRINDGMGRYVSAETIKCLVATGRPVVGASIVVLGLTFKENCSDLRNTKVVDVVRELESHGARVTVHDPRADPEEAMREFGIALVERDSLPPADAVVLAVAHREFVNQRPDSLLVRLAPGGWVIDVKSVLDRQAVADLGFRLWRL